MAGPPMSIKRAYPRGRRALRASGDLGGNLSRGRARSRRDRAHATFLWKLPRRYPPVYRPAACAAGSVVRTTPPAAERRDVRLERRSPGSLGPHVRVGGRTLKSPPRRAGSPDRGFSAAPRRSNHGALPCKRGSRDAAIRSIEADPERLRTRRKYPRRRAVVVTDPRSGGTPRGSRVSKDVRDPRGGVETPLTALAGARARSGGAKGAAGASASVSCLLHKEQRRASRAEENQVTSRRAFTN